MAATTWTMAVEGLMRRAAVCVFVVLVLYCAPTVSSVLTSQQQENARVSYFPNSHHNFEIRTQLTEVELAKRELDIQRLKRDLDSLSPDVLLLHDGLEPNVLQVRRKREVTPLQPTTKAVSESTTGVLIDFKVQHPANTQQLQNRRFILNATSGNPEMFEVNDEGQLMLRDGYQLDYEDQTMRTITFEVHAISNDDPSDVYQLNATLTVTNVDEPPVWTTQPQPYKATVRRDTGDGYSIITVQASDPEGRPIIYEKTAVVPSQFNDRIELRTTTGELRTLGSGLFVPEGQVISVTVSAKDAASGGNMVTTTISVVIGVLPPQFYQTSYQGSMLENNKPQQTVYKLGTEEELRLEWKTFQTGAVSLALTQEGGARAQNFTVQQTGSLGYIICTKELDYETANPKNQSFTLTATQTVGDVLLSSTVDLTVAIQDKNDNPPVFDQSQYLTTVREDLALDQSVIEVRATDKDTGLNAQIVYSLLDTEDFYIETSMSQPNVYKGIIKVKRRLDYDRPEGPYYIFKVKASDLQGSQSSTSNVRISVTNINDEAPSFLPSQVEAVYEVQENAQINQFITQIVATDGDGDKVSYSFNNGNLVTSKFKIEQTSGLITLVQPIADIDDRFTLMVKATDDGSCCGGTTRLTSSITIYVQVIGVNSHRPDFVSCSTYSPSVVENSPPGTSVQTVVAQDDDRGPNGVVTYQLTQGGNAFSINSSTGLITVKTNIDREVTPFVQVTVLAKDGGTPSEEGYCTFRITINDANDHAPRFDKPSYMANITTSTPAGSPFLFVRAYDEDVGDNAKITYSMPNNAEGKFQIIPETGFISLSVTLTRHSQSFSLTVMAKDGGLPTPLNSTVNVLVNVQDGNTEPPQWDQNYNTKTYTVAETVVAETRIIENMQCNPNVPSDWPNQNVEFQLMRADGSAGAFNHFFKLQSNGNSVDVLATGKFDYLNATKHTVRIRCLNFGSPAMLTETNPLVVLQDTNNQIPVFQGELTAEGRYSASVQENKPADTTVMTIEASDADTDSPFNVVTFSITNGGNNFQIEQGTEKPNTAILRTRVPFDKEAPGGELYYVEVKATDGAPSSLAGMNGEPNTAIVNVAVKITDVNDNAPYFEQDQYNISVKESTYINNLIEPAIRVSDKDSSDQGKHTYRIMSGNTNNAFGIRDGLGNLFPLRKLDYEGEDKHFMLVVRASDGLHYANTTVSVTVLDVNDNSPTFDKDVYKFDDFYENDFAVPRSLTTINATDADVDRPNHIRYSLEGSSFVVSDYFSINAISGELQILRALDRDPPNGRPNWQFTVKAADELENPNYGYATVSVMPKDLNDNKPQFITDPLEASVREGATQGSLVVQLQVLDVDYKENGTVEFFLVNITDGALAPMPGYFILDQTQGFVTTAVEGSLLDRETMDTYLLTIRLRDKGSPTQENVGVLKVTLSDINDEKPVFQQKIYRRDMSENLQSGEVIRVVAKDKDIGENARIFYSLVNNDNHFKVIDIDNEGSVQVVPENPVDYEDPNQRFFNLTVRAQDFNSDHEDTCYVEITVKDFNDNAPVIEPLFKEVKVREDMDRGQDVFNFTATDADSTKINREFEFSISRASNPRRHFSIDPASGLVKVRRHLDRETQALHELIILAIDKGSPPKTGSATLVVIVEDVNDNPPSFLEHYNPHVLENKNKGVPRQVQEVLGTDPDAPPYGAPFGFQLDTACGDDCKLFSFRVNEGSAGGNGSFTVSTDQMFDREQQKYYRIPIIMWDMRGKGSSDSMTGTNTLTITIADENDNPMGPGTQNIFVYNYKGQFGPIEIGRVYVEDADDWDLPDKTFVYQGADWMRSYFTVDNNTGMVTMKKGVPSSPSTRPYTFQVQVRDNVRQETVTSTVAVTVEELSEEAVRNSGGTRFRDTSAEEFIRVPSSTEKSPSQKFKELLAQQLNTSVSNVQVISVQDVEGGYTDVRYSLHGSPYYPSSQTDSIVALKKKEFEDALALKVEEVPIDACQEEVFEGGCYNYMDITGNPAMVNSNGTSFVGVEVFIRAAEGCRALDFPEPNECSGDYCYHGGTCVKNKFGVLSCVNCPEGFDGPRCQQLRHSFDGKSYAMYPTLEQCEDSETSIEFITTQADGQLLYNGPMLVPVDDKPEDYISLQLAGGMPVLYLDHGSGSVPLALDGKDQGGSTVISTLADGKWHKITIVRKGKHVEMTVDDCRAAGPSGSESQAPDLRPCKASANTQGDNSFLNVATLLHLGGRPTGHTYPTQPNAVTNTGFNGCVRNLIHNSKYYDLHYKPTPQIPSGQNGCPREDEHCMNSSNKPMCGNNGVCVASFEPSEQPKCICKPGWRGNVCTQGTEVRDFRRESFLQWQVNNGQSPLSYELEVQVMYRTWDSDGVLFTVSTPDNTKRVTMQVKDGRLEALYNLDTQDNILLLNNSQAADGYWHVARFKRVMHTATLTLDDGEGRNHVTHYTPHDNVYMTLTPSAPMYGGASVTNPSGAQVLDRDLSDTCVKDVRLNGAYLPIRGGENTLATLANHVGERNIEDGCLRADGCVPPPVCPLNAICIDLWGKGECRCAPGYHELANGACESDCLPENPCFRDVPCYITQEGEVGCNCTLPWSGPLCNIYPTDDKSSDVGMASASIIAIVVSIILVLLLLLLVFFLVAYYKRKKNRDEFDKIVVEADADYDIRENVMFYDEEGAGEEDQNAFDLAKLPSHENETQMRPPVDMVPLAREQPQGRRAPDDRPDVGNVLHDRMDDADNDPDAPPYDTLITFNDEGAGSDAGSLSSLGSSSSDASHDYDYLNEWGPKFARLADMYGAGQE